MIKVGSTLFLEVNDGDDTRKRYRSKVLDIEDNHLFIDYPVDEQKKKAHFFGSGTEFRAWFLADNGIFLFNTEVIGKAHRNLPMLYLKDPGGDNYIRIQRRQYVRVDCSVDVAIHALNENFDPFTSISLDLSGGGFALLLPNNHPLEVSDEISAWFALNYQSGEILYINTEAKIVRIYQENGKPRASFQFNKVNETDRQKIVRFCFEKQLAHRK
ncbi:flagellar brake domain-containing protein [Evansella sp. AB-P1]|uniref:flagellar brake protein n=1 Tax=Evansella sp. AB-P1 TaxID=3037653 RepID=UPI00241F8093|nr:flagellar brake domain-containing protein [Evansella sp. AB-P1]MDG5787621.1 flagellar brake domain-containing protein [Evansella sp. AB-P1]